MGNLCMSTKELLHTYYYDDIHTNRNSERTKVVKGRTVIELGTKTATSFVGNLYRVFDHNVKSYKQLLLVGVAKQNPNIYIDYLDKLEEIASENAWVNPSVKLILEPEDSTIPFKEDYFIDLCIVLGELIPEELLLTDEELGIINI